MIEIEDVGFLSWLFSDGYNFLMALYERGLLLALSLASTYRPLPKASKAK